MTEKLIGIAAIGKALVGSLSEVEAMRSLLAMKKAGYRVETDKEGAWTVPVEDVELYLNGGKKPKPPAETKKADGDKGDPGDKGPFKIEHKGRGRWAIVDTRTGDPVDEETFDKKKASALVNELNAKPAAASIETDDE